ncbi:MAG: signal peptide peptidase SppA [Ignavibacteriales bacterium]|nr:MAG: signal peptide peptidase SppA [Ignavibacteriales bacterium]
MKVSISKLKYLKDNFISLEQKNPGFKMKTKLITLLVLLLYSLNFSQEGFSSFYERNDFLLASPGAMKYGLYGYDNPAQLTYVDNFDLMFALSNRYNKLSELKNWGLFAAISNVGFGVLHNRIGSYTINDYKLSLAAGDRNFSFGIGYGWSTGNKNIFKRTDIITLGTLIRPMKHLSVGLTGTSSTTINSKEIYADIAVRPLGNEIVSVFGDFYYRNKPLPGIKTTSWSLGFSVEVLSGLILTAKRNFETEISSAGISLGLGNVGFTFQEYKNDKGNEGEVNGIDYRTFAIRVGGYERNLASAIFPPKNYLEMNMKEGIKYQNYKFFDNSSTLLSVIQQINAAKDDPTIKGIAINTSGFNTNKEFVWEIRERLREFKQMGKKVIVFIDNPDLTIYHLASVADKIVMDPLGQLNILGYLMGRTFYKNALDMLGVGIDELRFFKYKSAAESFSREQMSEADKEQRQKLIDNNYELARKDICEGRNFSPEQFDNYVNNYGILLANTALENKLVDTLARWDAVPDIIKNLEGTERSLVGAGSIEKFKLPKDNYWGEPDRIAIIYALGECAMDQGITARRLVKDVEAAGNDPLVKAIVLRVDSPGGDGMASDYIAEALKKIKKTKPVIVSQGTVAASGGYWLSMYADTIVAAPNTTTGSIGVISMWAYNKGLKEKIGLSTDYVKRGDHADLFFGMTLPFVGLSLPDRPLTEDERGRYEWSINNMYKDFVGKVSNGRNLTLEYVDSIGQGRVWSGKDGKQLKLVDVIGGLDDAIKIAKQKAGIQPDEEVNLVQYPEMALFNFDFLQPKIFGFETKADESMEFLKFRLENAGKPMPVLPLDDCGSYK